MIPFIDLKTQQKHIYQKIKKTINRVLEHGQYILGPEVEIFEKKLTDFCGAKYAISCANGTDALALALTIKNIKRGDAIFVPSFTFAASPEVVAWFNATIVFIDINPKTFNIDPESLEQGILYAKKNGLIPKGIMTVDLFGLPADYLEIEKIAKKYNLWILCDTAQGFGGEYYEKKTGNIGDISATSFFPAKPLGCYGDGGAVFTNNEQDALLLKSLRMHGQGENRYDHVHIGRNSRLDTIQAAILIEKIAIFPEELIARQKIADSYTAKLQSFVQTPIIPFGLKSAWAQYTIILPKGTNRSLLQEKLKQNQIPSVVYYPKPMHLQTAYNHYPTATGSDLPICEELAYRVLSLPMHPYLLQQNIETISKVFKNYFE